MLIRRLYCLIWHPERIDNQLQLQERITTVSSAYHLHIVAAVIVWPIELLSQD